MKSKKTNINLLLIGLFAIIFTISCSSVFNATISGSVQAEPRNNSSSEEQTNLANANVYVFFNESEWQNYKTKWDNHSSSNSKSISSTIDMPNVSDTIRTTTTNTNGGFSIKTMWITNSPLFGKDGDEKTFYIAVYHKDYGMFFDEKQYSVFSDSSQNISFICEYDEKLKNNYSINVNLFDYSNNNKKIELEEVNPKVVIKYKLITSSNKESDVGEITQIFEELPKTNNGEIKNTYSFIDDKYYFDSDQNKFTNELVYPVGKIYFYDKGEEGNKTFRMSNEKGFDLSQSGVDFAITENSNILSKDIYVDRLNRDYRLKMNLNYPQNSDNDSTEASPTLEQFSPKTTIKVYFDGYNNINNSIDSPDSIISKDELYKTFTYSVDEVPNDGYYTFNVDRQFDKDNNEIFASISYQVEDDTNNIEYIQTDIDNNLIDDENEIDKTLTNYYKDNYTTSVDTYLDKVKLDYTLEFNIENFETGNKVNLSTNEDDSSFNAKIKLFILAYDGTSKALSELDFSNAKIKNPDERLNSNTISFEWDKYNSEGEIQYPAIKYFLFDEVDPNYCQITSEDNITYTHIKTQQNAIDSVNPISFTKGVIDKSIDVDVEKLCEDYTLNFRLNDIEDKNADVNFSSFNPKVKLNIYKTEINNNNLVESKYYKQAKTDGIYNFKWGKYGDNLDLIDLPNTVNESKVNPIVKYYFYNTNEDSYQMLQSETTESPIVVTDINNAPSTSFINGETSKDIDVYLRLKKIKYNLTFKLINIATDDEISISNFNPIVKIYYNNGKKDVVDTFNNIPMNNQYQIEVEREDTLSTPIKIDMQDKRSEVRYRLCSKDPNNEIADLRYTVGESESERYQEQYTLTKVKDNELKLYLKDYQYPSSIKIEGRFIEFDDEQDNNHTLWLIPKINTSFNEEEKIKLRYPTQQNFKNATDSYDPSNIENGYFSTTYTQTRIATFDEYPSSSKYLEQQFKIIVNKIQNESNPQLDETDYMSIFNIKNNSNNSEYVYVDNSITYNK